VGLAHYPGTPSLGPGPYPLSGKDGVRGPGAGALSSSGRNVSDGRVDEHVFHLFGLFVAPVARVFGDVEAAVLGLSVQQPTR